MSLPPWEAGLLVRVALYWLVFWPTVGYYVYTDAGRRELPRQRLLAVGFGALGVVGLIGYLWWRDRDAD